MGRMVTKSVTVELPPELIAGDTTPTQREELESMLGTIVAEACRSVVGELDRRAVESVLKARTRLHAEIAEAVMHAIRRGSVSDKYKDETVHSSRHYPTNYRPKPIEAQVSELRRLFPALGPCMEKIARRDLPEGPEAWFAIPRWEALAPTYGEAVDLALSALAVRRRFSHRVLDRTGPTFLRQGDRSIMARERLKAHQPDQDIFVVPAQFGLLHRGSSARRARVAMAGHEYGLGVFAVACMLLTHPERLSNDQTLMIDCSGDEYSFRGDSTFDRVPLFDFDISGIEFSIFYEDRAWNLWGTPSAFLYKLD